MRDPDYQLRSKRRIGEIVYMSPSEYREKCQEIFIKIDGVRRVSNENQSLEYLESSLKDGIKMKLPSLDYYTSNQEGWHRSVVADRLGLEKIPVLVVRRATHDEWLEHMQKNHPDELKHYNL